MGKRRKLIILISCIIGGTLILYYYRPVKISRVIQDVGDSKVKIIHLKGSTNVINMNMETNEYELDGNSAKAREIFNLFTKYYLHSSIDTLTNDTSLNPSDDSVHIRYNKDRIYISDNFEIIIDGKNYKVGYFSRNKSKQLVKEIITILESN